MKTHFKTSFGKCQAKGNKITDHRHFFSLTERRKTRWVYQLALGTAPDLPDQIRLEKYKLSVDDPHIHYGLRLKTAPTWGASEVVPAFRPTVKNNVYLANRQQPNKSLLILQFSQDGHHLTVDCIPWTGPFSGPKLLRYLRKHPYYQMPNPRQKDTI